MTCALGKDHPVTGRPATLKDVARKAGVSTATVARVLHERGYVSAETRVAVQAAIAETGYQLNAIAQGLRRQRSYVLGHVVRSISPNPFFASMALGVDQEAARNDCGVLTANTHEDVLLERNAVETLIRRRVDAILFSTVRYVANVELALEANIPVIQVERVALPDVHSVTVDNYSGAFDAIDHLARFGHRRIAFIGEALIGVESAQGLPERSRLVERERVSGYRDALQMHGILYDENLIDLEGTYFDLHHVRQVTHRLLRLPSPPTAIFAACDYLACGVLQELYQAGKRVPDDISVIGFDDTIALNLSPPLTTVAQPAIEIGRAAVQMALDVLHDQANGQHSPSPPRRKRLETRLIVRESTGCVPAPLPSSMQSA
jgi:LacI family transcriptional regulator